MKYKFFEHTADVIFEAYGKSYEEAFENAAEAMFSFIGEVKKIKGKKSFVIEEEAESLENLTVFCLSDLLSESEIRDMLLCKVKVEKFIEKKGKFYLKAKAFGEEKKDEKVRDLIKAVTYHELKVEKNEKVKIRVLLDV
jgi:SHS2 domain-containing protein